MPKEPCDQLRELSAPHRFIITPHGAHEVRGRTRDRDFFMGRPRCGWLGRLGRRRARPTSPRPAAQVNLFVTHDNSTVVELMPRGVDIPIYNRLVRRPSLRSSMLRAGGAARRRAWPRALSPASTQSPAAGAQHRVGREREARPALPLRRGRLRLPPGPLPRLHPGDALPQVRPQPPVRPPEPRGPGGGAFGKCAAGGPGAGDGGPVVGDGVVGGRAAARGGEEAAGAAAARALAQRG